jgi:hypothetical protein
VSGNTTTATGPAPTCTTCLVPSDATPVVFPTATAPAATLNSCGSRCDKNSCCLIQYAPAAQACRTTSLVVDDDDLTTGNKWHITYKRGADWKGSPISVINSNGQFFQCKISPEAITSWALVGSNLDANAQPMSATAAPVWVNGNEATCRKTCVGSPACWGFIWDHTTKRCAFRGVSPPDNIWDTYFY